MSGAGKSLRVHWLVSVEGSGEGRPLRAGFPGGAARLWVARGAGGSGGDTCSLWGPQRGGRSHFTSVIGLPVDCPNPFLLKKLPRPRARPLSARPGTEGTRGTQGTGGRRPPARPALTGPGRLPPQGCPSSSQMRPGAWGAGPGRQEPPDPWGRPRGRGPSQGSGGERARPEALTRPAAVSAHVAAPEPLRHGSHLLPAGYLEPRDSEGGGSDSASALTGPHRGAGGGASPLSASQPRRSTHAWGGALRRRAVT